MTVTIDLTPEMLANLQRIQQRLVHQKLSQGVPVGTTIEEAAAEALRVAK